jgi:hypothetical protein
MIKEDCGRTSGVTVDVIQLGTPLVYTATRLLIVRHVPSACDDL